MVRRSYAVAALVVYGAALSFWAASRTAPLQPPALRDLAGGSAAGAVLAVAGYAAGAVALFLPVGFLALAALRGATGSVGLVRGLLAEALALAVAASVLLLSPGRGWHFVDALTLLLAAGGCTLGARAAVVWPGGPRARARLFLRAAAVTAAVVASGGALAWAALEPRPSVAGAEPIASEDKRRLYYQVRSANPRTIREGRTKTLRLTAHDLDVLASWARTVVGEDWRAAVFLGPGAVRVSGTLALPGPRRFLNVTLDARPVAADGRLSLDLRGLRLGRFAVPRPVLAALSPLVDASLRHDDRLGPFLRATRALDVQPSAVSVTYGRVDAAPESMADVLGQGLAGDVEADAVRAHVSNLVEDSRRMPAGEPAATAALRSAFAFARARSGEDRAAPENKAALVALGVLLGHPSLQAVVGPVVEPREWRAIGPALRRPRLRGRADWGRHFFLSAALAALSAGSVSDAAGLFKEELDADGGSGFSFADLLADRSGACFARLATRDEAAARALQERLAGGARAEEFFPDGSDLPERITDRELERDYGGVGGDGYRRFAEAIESRLPWCPR
jgi:hypothetical protein